MGKNIAENSSASYTTSAVLPINTGNIVFWILLLNGERMNVLITLFVKNKQLRINCAVKGQTVVSTGYNSTVTTLHTQLNTAQLYMATTRLRTILHVHNSTRHNSTQHNWTCHNSTRLQLDMAQFDTSKLDTAQFDTLQLYTNHMAVRLKLLQSSERYTQNVNVITIRQKSRNTNDTFVRTVRYSIVASTLQVCVELWRVELWPCRVVVCRVVVV